MLVLVVKLFCWVKSHARQGECLRRRNERQSGLSETSARLIVPPFLCFTLTPWGPQWTSRLKCLFPSSRRLNLGLAFRGWQCKLTFTGAVLGNTLSGRGEGHVFLLASAWQSESVPRSFLDILLWNKKRDKKTRAGWALLCWAPACNTAISTFEEE